MDKSLDSLLNKAANNKNINKKTSSNKSTSSKRNTQDNTYLGRSIKEQIIHFDISDNDDIMIASIKEYINKANLKNTDVYDVVGREQGYNMIYQLANKGVLSWTRLETWCMILGVTPILTFSKTTKTEDNK